MLLEISSWQTFKTICITTKDLSIQYTQDANGYDVYGPDANQLLWHARLANDGGPDVTDFLNNVAPTANGVIVPVQQPNVVFYPAETYTTTASFANIRQSNDLFFGMFPNKTIDVQNTGANAANVRILASLDGINFDIVVLASQSLAAGTGLHFNDSNAYRALLVQAMIPTLGSATTLLSRAFGVGG